MIEGTIWQQVIRDRITEEIVRKRDAHEIVDWIHGLEDEAAGLEQRIRELESALVDIRATAWDNENYLIREIADEALETAAMSKWQPIETAPRDGTAIQARIPWHGDDNIIAWTGGLVDSHDEDAGGWYFLEDQEPPDCWTDGICWASNEDGFQSIEPTHWRPLEEPPR